MEAVDTFGSWIRRRRRALDLTQEALAQQLGYSVVTVRKIEGGERRASREVAARLADCLAIPPEQRAAFLEAARRDPDAPVGDDSAEPNSAPDTQDPLNRSGAARQLPRQLPVAAPTSHHSSASPVSRVEPGIPADVSSFIGRKREVAALVRLLRRPGVRLVTLAGPPGIGKTRLALVVAESVCNDFADGAAYADLLPATCEAQVVAAVAAALDAHEEPGRTLLQTVQQALRSKNLLLVLDNFEQAVEAAPVVTALLTAAPNVKALVTSRVLLDLRGEHVFNVPPLASPDLVNLKAGGEEFVALLEIYEAVQLFVERAQAQVPEFELDAVNAPDVAEICRLLDGLPLAIELAAAWLRTLSCAEIAAEVRRDARFLTAARPAARHHLAERQRSVEAVFDSSWSLLTPAERKAFAALSIFRNGFTRVAAEQTTGASLSDLAGLVDKSFLRRNPVGRYDVHELLRQLGEARLRASGDWKRQCDAHSAYFMAFLADRLDAMEGPGQTAAIGEIRGEIENIRAGWDWAVGHEHWSHVASAAQTLYLFLSTVSWFEEMGQVFDRAVISLRQAIRANPHGAELTALLGRLMSYHGMYLVWAGWQKQEEVVPYLQESLALLERGGDVAGSAFAADILGYAIRIGGDLAASADWFAQSLWLARRAGDVFMTAIALNDLGNSHSRLGHYREAQRLIGESLALKTRIRDQRGAAFAEVDLATIATWMGDLEAARRGFAAGIAAFREMGDLRMRIYAGAELAHVHYLQGDYGEARSAIEETLAYAVRTGDPFERDLAYSRLGLIHAALGDYATALAEAQTGLDGFRAYASPPYVSMLLNCLGQVKLETGDHDGAHGAFEAALAGEESAGECHSLLISSVGLARAACLRGDLTAADHWGRRGLDLARELEARREEAEALWTLGDVALARREYPEARRSLASGAAVACEIGAGPLALWMLVSCARLLGASGQTEDATVLLGAVLSDPRATRAAAGSAAALLAELGGYLPLPLRLEEADLTPLLEHLVEE